MQISYFLHSREPEPTVIHKTKSLVSAAEMLFYDYADTTPGPTVNHTVLLFGNTHIDALLQDKHVNKKTVFQGNAGTRRKEGQAGA